MPPGMGGITGLRKLSMFIVGKEYGHHIMELKHLNLGGQLSIKDLQNAKDSIDAGSANLKLKKDLTSLELSWQTNGSNSQPENNEDVLQGLQPHSNLKKLSIDSYGGTKFPNWMMDLLLPNLVDIYLKGCYNCKYLPPFGKLQFLKKLELRKMDAVVSIDDDLYGCDEVAFPLLESMIIHSMRRLEQWLVPSGRSIFPLLRELTVLSCPKLADLPVFPGVKKLEIGAMELTLLKSVTNFPVLASVNVNGYLFEEEHMSGSLDVRVLSEGVMEKHKFVEELEISGFPSLNSLSNQLDNLSALKILQIYWCYNLESLPNSLQNLNRLETLIIYRCIELHSVSSISSLRRLSIAGCDKLASLSEGLQHLTALESLSVSACLNLNSLAESVRHLTSLRFIGIYDCKALSGLPNDIGYLTSLSVLQIEKCPNLRSLPEGVRKLMRLEELKIDECPHLERRCKKNGEDWVNIAHVPSIYIRGRLLNGD